MNTHCKGVLPKERKLISIAHFILKFYLLIKRIQKLYIEISITMIHMVVKI